MFFRIQIPIGRIEGRIDQCQPWRFPDGDAAFSHGAIDGEMGTMISASGSIWLSTRRWRMAAVCQRRSDSA